MIWDVENNKYEVFNYEFKHKISEIIEIPEKDLIGISYKLLILIKQIF